MTLLVFAVAVAVLLGSLFVSRRMDSFFRRRERLPRTGAWPVYATQPLSQFEAKLYRLLADALPGYTVLAQVALSRLVEVKPVPGRHGYFNKISQKSVDFVVCDEALKVVAVIELDDSSHDRRDRQNKDRDKDAALAAAGYRVIRWRSLPSVPVIRSECLKAASIAGAPRAVS